MAIYRMVSKIFVPDIDLNEYTIAIKQTAGAPDMTFIIRVQPMEVAPGSIVPEAFAQFCECAIALGVFNEGQLSARQFNL